MKFLLVAINAKYIHSNLAVYSLKSFAEDTANNYTKITADAADNCTKITADAADNCTKITADTADNCAKITADTANNCTKTTTAAGNIYVEIAEYTINIEPADILADIYARKPDILAFSCYIWNWETISRLLPEVKKVMPDVPVWLGGPEVSYDAGRLLQSLPTVTGIMRGESEETFGELCGYYAAADGDDLPARIKGIVYRRADGSWQATAARESIDLNRLPFPYRNLSDFNHRIIYYESSRGCPYNCSYCLSATEKTLRFKALDKVKAELTILLNHKLPQVKFVDRTFNCNRRHAMTIWQFIGDHDNGITNFHFEIAADLLTDAEMALLGRMRPGLIQLEIGVQSTNDATLNRIDRRTDFDKIKRAVSALQKNNNIHLHLDLIAGLPDEDYETFIGSFNAVYACRPDQLQLGFLKVLAGAPIRQQAAQYEIAYEDHPPYEVLFTRRLSYEHLCQLHKVEEMVEIFYNSGQFRQTLQVLEKAFPTPFDLYRRLAAFYETKGFYRNHPARGYRYQILLDFAVTYDDANGSRYRERLTFDLYLRENIKNRPAYAADLSSCREAIRNFYRQEALTHELLPHYAQYNAAQLQSMTHIDKFCGLTDAPEERPQYILFDYRIRDPLTNDAATIAINL